MSVGASGAVVSARGRSRRLALALGSIGATRLVLFAVILRPSELLGGVGLMLVAASFFWQGTRAGGPGACRGRRTAILARIVGISLVAASFVVMLWGPGGWAE